MLGLLFGSRKLRGGGRGRTRTYEVVRQRIYSPPPLPLGTLSQNRRTVLISKDKPESTPGRSNASVYGGRPGRSQWTAAQPDPRMSPACHFAPKTAPRNTPRPAQ